MSTKSNDNTAMAGGTSRVERRDIALQTLHKPATRARAPAARRALSASQISRNHAEISRSNDPGVEALEVRYRFYGRGLPEGGHAGLAKAVCLPDIRRRLQGSDDLSLSGIVATRRALHRLRADGVSGRRWRGMVARA